MNVTCIIPFHNEGSRILHVLKTLKKAPVHQILCIDDGSEDGMYKEIQKKFPNVRLIRLQKNIGKSDAIKKALPYIRYPTVYMLDGDLKNLQIHEIEKALSLFEKNSVDMIIFQRMKDPFLFRLLRTNVLLSGERILYKKDLVNAFRLKPQKYQIEAAINLYMMNHKKRVELISRSSRNTVAVKKYGIIKGILHGIRMDVNILSFIGVQNFIKQAYYFSSASEYIHELSEKWNVKKRKRLSKLIVR